jgi:hypothetical protein
VLNNSLKYSDPSGHAPWEGDLSCSRSAGCPGEYLLPKTEKSRQWSTNVATYGTTAVEIAASVAFEPVDYALSARDGYRLYRQGEYAMAGATVAGAVVPGVSGRLAREAVAQLPNVARAARSLCSFSEDTLVSTGSGLVPISEVSLGTLVLAYNEETSEIGYYPVVAIWEHEDPVIVQLVIDGEVILTTPEHPFYTEQGDWLTAASLQVGDKIRQADWQTGTVEAITSIASPQTMYNFTVAAAHTYFVGEGQWLVHNDCLGDFLAKVSRSAEPGSRSIIGQASGSLEQAERMFQNLVDPTTIEWLSNEKRFRGYTSDGYQIGFRPVTSSGSPAIDLHSLFDAGLSPYRWVHVKP